MLRSERLITGLGVSVVTWRIVRSRRTTPVPRLSGRIGPTRAVQHRPTDGPSENIRLRPLVAERADRHCDDENVGQASARIAHQSSDVARPVCRKSTP